MPKRVVTIHHDRLALDAPFDGPFKIKPESPASFEVAYYGAISVASFNGLRAVHVEIELAPTALIVCRHCLMPYTTSGWNLAIYYEREHAPNVIVDTRRCACGVDLTPEHTHLRSIPTVN